MTRGKQSGTKRKAHPVEIEDTEYHPTAKRQRPRSPERRKANQRYSRRVQKHRDSSEVLNGPFPFVCFFLIP